MKKKIINAVLILTFFLAGCSAITTTATLYPVKGPLSKLQPLPVLTATVDGITGNTGNISLTMVDGEFCKGRWSSIAPISMTYSTASTTGSVTRSMSSAWTTVYGSSFSVSNLPGVNKGEAMLVGNKGTIIHAEFYTGSGTANGSGVAKDNKGNIFKIIF